MTTAHRSHRPTEVPSVWTRIRNFDFPLLTDRELFKVGFALALVVAAILWLIFSVIEPPPPKKVTITTGGTSGAYFSYGKKYAEQFKTHGIELTVLESKGSVENLARLNDDKSEVKIGLVQGGVGDSASSPKLESLASITFEPIWVFYAPEPGERVRTTLGVFSGKRVGIGPEGSGARAAALKLFKVNELDASNMQFSDLSGVDAVQAVLDKKLDAVFLVASSDAASVTAALTRGLIPVSFEHADAYVRLMPWLTKITMPHGVVSLSKNLPKEDVKLLSTSANLVVRKDLHPAVAFLLMDIASELHRPPTILNDLNEFPNEKALVFAQSAESKRFFKTGRPFLQRYLPFWLANVLERLGVTLLPALAIVIPLIQIIPKFFKWREQAVVARLYHELEILDARGDLTPENRHSALAHLDLVEQKLQEHVPSAGHFVDVYNLRAHLDMLRARVRADT